MNSEKVKEVRDFVREIVKKCVKIMEGILNPAAYQILSLRVRAINHFIKAQKPLAW